MRRVQSYSEENIRDSELSFEHFISPFEFVISTFVDLLFSFWNNLGGGVVSRMFKLILWDM